MISTVGATFAVAGRNLVADVNLTIEPGLLTVLIGPNGAGKSTLFRLIAGEIRPTAGAVRLGARDLAAVPVAELALKRAVVPQHTTLSFPFTTLEVVMLGVTVPGLVAPGPRARALAHLMLTRVSIGDLADRLYPTLSGGERQRVQMARALAQLEALPDRSRPRALLVDEPTASLDIAHQLAVLDELGRQARQGRAVLAVLHDINLAAAYADTLVLMVAGSIVAAGSPREVLTPERLSAAYGCNVRLDTVPENAGPFLLPQACSIMQRVAVTSDNGRPLA